MDRFIWTEGIGQRIIHGMEYCLHNSVIEEWWVNAVHDTSDEIVRICRRFLYQDLHYFTGLNMI